MSTINFTDEQTLQQSFCYHQQGQLKIASPWVAPSRRCPYCTNTQQTHSVSWSRNILPFRLTDLGSASRASIYHEVQWHFVNENICLFSTPFDFSLIRTQRRGIKNAKALTHLSHSVKQKKVIYSQYAKCPLFHSVKVNGNHNWHRYSILILLFKILLFLRELQCS